MTELLDASLGPTLDQVMATLRPFVRTNDDGSFVAPKDEALSDLLTLAASMAKSIASRPSAIVEEPMVEAADRLREWALRIEEFRDRWYFEGNPQREMETKRAADLRAGAAALNAALTVEPEAGEVPDSIDPAGVLREDGT